LESLKIKGEWFFQFNVGPVLGPFSKAMTTNGLERFAAKVAGLDSPFIAMGNSGGEAFRKRVGAVIQTGTVLRFRISLSLSEGNGNHAWIGVFSDATEEIGSGVQINELTQNFSKNNNQVLNVECRFTFQQGV
jgi:hypothetical protein